MANKQTNNFDNYIVPEGYGYVKGKKNPYSKYTDISDSLGDVAGPIGGFAGDLIEDIPGIGQLNDLVGGLFGDDKPDWKPYIDENGNYVWNNPNKSNPVPLNDVPGSTRAPGKTYRKIADQVKAITDLLPYYSKAVAGQIIPTAQAQLVALQQTQPGMNELDRNRALYQVGTDSAALEAAQQSLIPNALEAAKLYDPEYFATRELTSQRLKDLMSSINLDSGLSDVERREIEQSLAQQGTRRGTYSAPSNLETISNATQYGAAGRARQSQNRSELSQAIAAATAALPAFKSGVDVFQVATGKSSGNSFGQNAVTNALNTNAGAASGIGQNATQLQLQQMQINANKKDWADYMNQVTSSISDLGSIAGGIAGM